MRACYLLFSVSFNCIFCTYFIQLYILENYYSQEEFYSLEYWQLLDVYFSVGLNCNPDVPI